MAKFKALIGLGVGLFMTALATQAEASSFTSTVSDTGTAAYWGGTDETTGWGDIIGNDPPFGITSMTVYKNEGDDALYVDILTNYSGANVGSISTSAGALFLGDPNNLTINGGTQTNLFTGDIYSDGGGAHVDDLDRFSHALDYTNSSGAVVANPSSASNSGTGGDARLYALNGDATDVVTTSHGGTNRNFQAYDVNHAALNDPTATAPGSTWYTEAGLFSFSIANFFSSENPLTGAGGIYEFGATIAWTMLCGNDVILAQFAWEPGGGTPEVPLPAGVILLFSGLLGLGFLARSKAKKAAI